MAYVGITDKLVNSVTAKINTLEQAEVQSLGDESKYIAAIKADPEVLGVLNTITWGSEIDLMPRLSKYNKECYVNIAMLIKDGFSATLAFEFQGPCFLNHDRWNKKQISIATAEQTGLMACESIQAWKSFVLSQYECRKRWKQVRESVVQFLNAAKSLNEAIKLWPDLQRYCPDEAIKKMNTKTERTKSESSAADVLAKIDVDTVNMSTVLARMAGAKV